MLTNFKMIAATLLLAVMAIPVSASPIWDVDFDNETPGSGLTGIAPVANVVSTGVTSGTFGNGSTLLAQDGFGALGGGGDIVAVITNAGAASGQLGFDGVDSVAVSSEQYSVTYDTLFTGASTGNGFFTAQSSDPNPDRIVQVIHDFTNERVGLNIFDNAGGFTGTTLFSANSVFLSDVVNSVEVLFDFDNNTVDVFLNGNAVSAVSGALGVGVDLDFFRIGTTGGLTQAWAFNNVATSIIPEPSSIALVSFGLIGMIGLGARRRK